jgi:serine/threonine protein kinase
MINLTDLVDHRTHPRRYVALKILTAEEAKRSNELKIIRHLARAAGPKFPKRVVALLDEFKHRSHSGTHLCLVFELMGPDVNHMLEELPELPAASLEQSLAALKGRYPVCMAKRMLKQVLQALTMLHQNGIAHGDIQPENMLFSLMSLEDIESDKMCQDNNYKWGSISDPVKRKEPLTEFANIGPEFRIKLSDLGGG